MSAFYIGNIFFFVKVIIAIANCFFCPGEFIGLGEHFLSGSNYTNTLKEINSLSGISVRP